MDQHVSKADFVLLQRLIISSERLAGVSHYSTLMTKAILYNMIFKILLKKKKSTNLNGVSISAPD